MTLPPRILIYTHTLAAVIGFALCWAAFVDLRVEERDRREWYFASASQQRKSVAEHIERQQSQDVVRSRVTVTLPKGGKVTLPDGKSAELPEGATLTAEHEEAATKSAESTDRKSEEVRTEIRYVTQIEEHERIVTPAQPRWSVGAGIGVDVRALSPVYQVDAAYRLIGPLSVSAFVQVRQVDLAPMVGVGLRVVF